MSREDDHAKLVADFAKDLDATSEAVRILSDDPDREDLDDDDIKTLADAFGLLPDDDKFNPDDPDDFDAGDLLDELRTTMADRPLCAETEVTINVTFGTGGPACGVMFDVDQGQFGYELTGGRAWWQDWFSPKTFHTLDASTATEWFDALGLEYMGDS